MNMASHGWGCERYGWHAFVQPLGSQTVLYPCYFTLLLLYINSNVRVFKQYAHETRTSYKQRVGAGVGSVENQTLKQKPTI